jgi:opacity protein-like surface antigen
MTTTTRSNEDGRSAAGRVAGAIAALAAALTFALAPAEARAQEASGRPAKAFGLVIDAGAAFVHEPGFGHGLRYGAGVFFKTARRAAFEIVLERFEVPVEEGAGQDEAGIGGLTAGRMRLTSVVFNQHVYIVTRGRFRPFATVGVGFDFITFAADDAMVTPQRDLVDRLALQLGGGVDVRFTDRLALTGRVRYNMAKTWIQDLPAPDPIREVDPLAQHMLNLFGLELSLGVIVTF